MNKKHLIVAWVILFLFLSLFVYAEENKQETAPLTKPSELENLSKPEPGHGHVYGVVFNNKNEPCQGKPIYLINIDKKELVSRQPLAFTDKDGKWLVLNVPVGRYIVFFWAPGPVSLVYYPSEVGTIEDGKITEFPTLKSSECP
jgi:hypothetical protein